MNQGNIELRQIWRAAGCLSIALAMFSANGCRQSSLNLAAVHGTVKYQGKALNRGNVVFTPEPGTPGAFDMRTGEAAGAEVGKYRVTVHLRRILTPEEEKRLVIPEPLIPVKYLREDETPLRFEVKSGSNEFPIELN
jgi:hypothetical protein